MRIALAGITFDVGPDDVLGPDELSTMRRLAREIDEPARLRLTVVDAHDTTGPAVGMPASVECVGDKVTLAHATFAASLDPFRGEGVLRRRPGAAYPLEITLRVALASQLPLAGGLPLHAAGVVVQGRGVAFFGVSGAGKSTLAATSPYPVLSDELVAVSGGEGFGLAASGFWGALGDGELLRGRFPLRALVQLGKGPTLRWNVLPPQTALRDLINVLLVPACPPLWNAALAVVARLLQVVPVYRMEWNPTAPPWPEMVGRLGLAG
jgi:hypothetical protein